MLAEPGMVPGFTYMGTKQQGLIQRYVSPSLRRPDRNCDGHNLRWTATETAENICLRRILAIHFEVFKSDEAHKISCTIFKPISNTAFSRNSFLIRESH